MREYLLDGVCCWGWWLERIGFFFFYFFEYKNKMNRRLNLKMENVFVNLYGREYFDYSILKFKF